MVARVRFGRPVRRVLRVRGVGIGREAAALGVEEAPAGGGGVDGRVTGEVIEDDLGAGVAMAGGSYFLVVRPGREYGGDSAGWRRRRGDGRRGRGEEFGEDRLEVEFGVGEGADGWISGGMQRLQRSASRRWTRCSGMDLAELTHAGGSGGEAASRAAGFEALQRRAKGGGRFDPATGVAGKTGRVRRPLSETP